MNDVSFTAPDSNSDVMPVRMMCLPAYPCNKCAGAGYLLRPAFEESHRTDSPYPELIHTGYRELTCPRCGGSGGSGSIIN